MTDRTPPPSALGRAWAWLFRHWRVALPVGVVLGAVGAWLFFGYFGFHTLFFDEEVEEAPPVFASGAGASGLPSDAMDADLAASMTEAMADGDMPAVEDVAEEMPMETAGAEILRSGMFVDRSHPTSGTALILGDGSGQRFLRLEDLDTDNGPDLNVYLSAAPPDAPAGEFDDDFVDLGDLKGNVGSQNYEVPPEVDLDRYRSVVIWCVRFGVAFGAAPLDA